MHLMIAVFNECINLESDGVLKYSWLDIMNFCITDKLKALYVNCQWQVVHKFQQEE